MKLIRDVVWLVVLGAAFVVLVRGGPTLIPGGGGRDGLYSDFEDMKVWDISPEEGFTLALSTDHVTQGRHALKVQFPTGDWPSINTKKLQQPVRDYEAFAVDVFNPQEDSIKFAVRLDDRARKNITINSALQPGMNRVRIPHDELRQKIDPGALARVVLFLRRPQQAYTLYFDNLRLTTPEGGPEAPPKAQAAPTVREAQRETGRVTPLAELPAPLPEPPPVTAGTVELRVVKLRDGSEPASLVSNGIPFAPGQLHSARDVAFFAGGQELAIGTQVLARWPQDQSIRSLLVQFRLEIPKSEEGVTMRWGAPRTREELALTDVAWEYPEGFLALPAWWLCESRVIGEQVPMYEHEFSGYDDRIRKYYPKRRDDRLTGDIRKDGYYSTPHVFYQLYVRSGDLDQFLAARREALWYRDHEIQLEGENRGRHVRLSESRYLYVEPLVDDYLLTGDPRSREVAGYMAEYLKRRYDPGRAFYPKDATNFWTEREIAFPFLGIVSYYELSGAPEDLAVAERYMDSLYRMQLQWPGRGGFIHNLYAHDTTEGARPDEYGGSPFMTGLLLEAIVKYHQLTGGRQAAHSIFMALDWLLNEGLASDGETFLYLTADQYRHEGGPPDLNLVVVHALGYGYKLSGQTRPEYLEVGRRVFQRGIEDAYLGQRKHFNQNYRSSAHFLAYIARPSQGAPETGSAPATEAAGPDEDVLYAADFEYSLGGWTAPFRTIQLARDADEAYGGRSSLKVQGESGAGELFIGKAFDVWDIRGYPTLRFAYKIPPGLEVALRCQTNFGDWIELGRTGASTQEGGEVTSVLANDGVWHETTVDVGTTVRQVLPDVQLIQALEVATGPGEDERSWFWIDEVVIDRGEQTL